MFKKIAFTILLITIHACQSQEESFFKVCKNRQMISPVVLETKKVRSQIECAAACAKEASCRSSNYIESNGTCELLPDVTFYTDCENVGETSTGSILKKSVPRCIFGGQWNWELSKCTDCDYGFTGTHCGRLIMDCAEGRELGYSGWEKQMIQPLKAKKPLKIICDFEWGATYIERRGEEEWYRNSNRNWYDYKHGIGGVWNDYFIGLETLHLRTSQRRTSLKVTLIGNDRDEVEYKDFIVDNEANNYTMRYSSFKSSSDHPGGDGFGLGAPNASLNGTSFCTPDRDCGSCAKDSRSGWWFNTACAEINLHTPLGTNLSLEWPTSTTDTTKQKKRKLHLILL